MKNFIKILLLCITGSMFAAVPAFGQAITISVDENGNGLIGSVRNDPGPGGHSTLIYFLPTSVGAAVQGDVLITDANPFMPFDWIRFNNDATLVFYSEFDGIVDNPVPLADTGGPGGLYANTAQRFEFGPPGPDGVTPDGVTYTPIPGEPGYDPTHIATYIITSDGVVPEPSTLALTGTGLLGLATLYRRRRTGTGA